MIVFIDLEHGRMRYDRSEQALSFTAKRLLQKYRFEEISGDTCLLVRYERADPDLLRKVGARAVLVSGAATDFEHYAAADLAGLRAIYSEAACPTLGLCAGHQLLAEAYNGAIDAIGPLRPDEPDPYRGTDYPQGMKQERGFMPVRLLQPHGLFAGLENPPVFFESHYWEVKEVPAGFHLLAEGDLCRVQAMAHYDRPLYGTQFHPEEYDDDNPAGRRLLENFFRLAGVLS